MYVILKQSSKIPKKQSWRVVSAGKCYTGLIGNLKLINERRGEFGKVDVLSFSLQGSTLLK